MNRLRRNQKRLDNLKTDIRLQKRGRVGRIVYLVLLSGFALTLFDLFAGDLVYLRGDGMVARDVSIIAPEFAGTAVSINVAPGDKVEAGQVLAVVRSQRVLKDIAELSAQVAVAEGRLSQLSISRQKLAALIPAARQRLKATSSDLAALRRLRNSGLTTRNRAATAESKSYEAFEALKELETEAELVEAEYARFKETAERARRALTEIDSYYGGGILRAARSGMVGNVLAVPGEGIKDGQRVIELFHGAPYVLAYVPLGALYEVSPGDPVVVRYGFQTVSGVLETPRQVALRLPQEFQRQFRTVDRKQLVRVRLADDAPPPLFTEIEVTWPGSIRVIMADIANNAAAAFRAVWNGI